MTDLYRNRIPDMAVLLVQPGHSPAGSSNRDFAYAENTDLHDPTKGRAPVSLAHNFNTLDASASSLKTIVARGSTARGSIQVFQPSSTPPQTTQGNVPSRQQPSAAPERQNSVGSGASRVSSTGVNGQGQVGGSPVPSTSSCSFGRQRSYRLEVISSPVYCQTSGSMLCSPTLVGELHVEQTSTVSSREGSSEPDGRRASNGSLAQDDLPYLIASVSVWSSDGTQQLMPIPAGTVTEAGNAPPQPLLRGRLVVHGQAVRDASGAEHIYFIFAGIQLTQPGAWRLGVSLFGLWPTAGSLQSRRRSSQESVANDGTLLATVIADTPTTAFLEEDMDGLRRAMDACTEDPRHEQLEDFFANLSQQGVDIFGSEQSSDGSEPRQ